MPNREEEVFTLIRNEIVDAINKHSVDRTPLSDGLTEVEKLCILMEEVGEVARCLTYDHRGTRDQLIGELIQVAAMATMWIDYLL